MANKRPRPEESDEESDEGYPEDLFLDLNEEEKQDYQCNICLQVLRQPVFCQNIHFFCISCLKRWKDWQHLDVSYPPPETACPVCQTYGPFTEDSEMASIIGRKKVVCLEDKCKWTGDLDSYGDHINNSHKQRGPSPRRLRSSTSQTSRITYYFH